MRTQRTPFLTWAEPTHNAHPVDRAFNQAVTGLASAGFFWPTTDVLETPEAFEIHLHAAGLSKEAFVLEVVNRRLTVKGRREAKRNEDGRTYHRIETPTGAFSRVFQLPEAVDPNGITAEYVQGVLRIAIPKTEQPNGNHTIEVK